MATQHSIEHLGLGQPIAHDTSSPQTDQDTAKMAPASVSASTSTSTSAAAAPPAGQEIPTTNPSVHVVLTNPLEKPASSPMPPAVMRSRADTNASTLSSASSRSIASTTTSTMSSDLADDDDDDDNDADDYDPASGGGDAGEKSCLKEKRIKEWRKKFHPKDGEELLCTHGCALVVDIMMHGRMYLSNKRICFRSNILGVRTKREIPLKHIHAVALRNVAGMIPNSFEVYYNNKKSQFTTLPDRDHTLRILLRNWKNENPQVYDVFIDNHPEFASYVANGGTSSVGDTTAVVPATTANNDDPAATVAPTTVVPAAGAVAGSEKGTQPSEQSDARKNPTGAGGGPRAATKADTPDLEKVALDTILPSEPEKIYKLLYHNDEFLQGIWKEEGFKDIEMQPWTNNRREFSFARPVASIGSTTCKSSEEIIHPAGQDEWFCVQGVTCTPGVPSGKSFSTKSKTVFTWAEGGGTKMHVTFQVEWTGKSLLKGTIISQSESGQKHWNSLLAKKIRGYIKAHPEEFPRTKGVPAGAGEGSDEDDTTGAGDVGAGIGGVKSGSAAGGPKVATAEGGVSEPRDPMSSVQSQLGLLQSSGILAYLLDDPIRGALLVFFLGWLLSYLLGTGKRLLWTGKMVALPGTRVQALEAAEEELRVLVGDVRAHLERTAAEATSTAMKAGQTVGSVVREGVKGVVGSGAKGVVGGTGKVVTRTVVP